MLTKDYRSAFTVFLTILLMINIDALAQWTKTAGPPGINVNYFYQSGNVLFAATTARGVFRSTDNGLTWHASNSGMANSTVFTIIGENEFLFAGTDNGVFRSSDSGLTWQSFSKGIEQKFVKTFYIANGYLFAGTVGSGLYKSSDLGLTWTDANGNALSSSIIHAITFAAPHLVVVADNLVFYSDDNGDSWLYEYTSPFILTGIPSFFTTADSVILVAGRGIYRSFDGGVNWGNFIPVIPAKQQANIMGLISTADKIIAGSRKGIFYSSDFGETWKSLPSVGLRDGSWFDHYFYASGNNLLLAFDEIGVAYSADKGRSWYYTLNGFTPAATIDDAVTTSGKFLLSGTHGDEVYASSNSGNSWTKIGTANNADTLSNSNIFSLLVVSNSIILAGTCEHGLYRSADKGATWTRIRNGLPEQQSGFLCVNSLAATTGNILIGTDKGLYYSSDLGLSWNPTNITGTGFDIVGIAANGTVACAASESIVQSNKIYRSADDGITWSSVFENFATDFTTIASNGVNHFYAGTLNGTNLLSNNNGLSWQNFGPGIPPSNGGYAIASTGNNVFTGNNAGVYFSNNAGATFTEQNTGLDASPNRSVQGLAVDRAYVYAGLATNSVWKRPLADFGISATPMENAEPIDCSISPNPVINKSVIRYHVEKKSRVTLKVIRYDGMLLQNLVDQVLATGNYSAIIDADKLLPGNYYIVITIGNKHAMKQVRVLKE